jgi:hypothetical protein
MSVRKILADAFGLPPTATEDEVIQAWADDIRSRQRAAQAPQGTTGQPMSFTELVDVLVQAKDMSYGQACSEASQMRPDLYAEHRAATMLSDEPRGMML